MKLLLTLAILLLVPISITVKAGETDHWDYWYFDGDSTAIENGWEIWYGPIHRRIAERWSMEVKCDTVEIDCDCPDSLKIYCRKIVTDTTWTKKLPVYLDSAHYDRLMELLKPPEPWDIQIVPPVKWDVDTACVRNDSLKTH